ncbi:MAG: crossover junction endodeoxyribonuclease RuvC [Pseudomonadota bacterium]|jgi:crossover junction endodeoxyribonuclease RuvC
MVRVLGIDPGSRVTGYGVIETDGVRSRHLESGCIRTADGSLAERLGEIFEGIRAVVEDTRPEQVAVEQVFLARNAASALKLGHARGAAVTAAVTAGLPVFEYSPREVKQALVGNGGAEKEQVQHMVRLILSLERKLALDQSDALAVALCHAHTHATASRLGRFA